MDISAILRNPYTWITLGAIVFLAVNILLYRHVCDEYDSDAFTDGGSIALIIIAYISAAVGLASGACYLNYMGVGEWAVSKGIEISDRTLKIIAIAGLALALVLWIWMFIRNIYWFDGWGIYISLVQSVVILLAIAATIAVIALIVALVAAVIKYLIILLVLAGIAGCAGDKSPGSGSDESGEYKEVSFYVHQVIDGYNNVYDVNRREIKVDGYTVRLVRQYSDGRIIGSDGREYRSY